MASMDDLRRGVSESLPEVNEIKDEELRGLVIEAWAFALSESEFTRIDQIRGSGVPDSPALKDGTQAEHLRGVARMAQGLADGLEAVHGDIGIDRDLLWACALCHDVGKPFEFSPRNQARWQNDVGAAGFPSIRHSVYGVHVALTVGLPEAVAHTAGAHSAEGELIKRSLENTLVNSADHAYWAAMERAGQLEMEDE
ncbi:MAG: HD domain-containing protein [Caldilineaceae bacterium SB0675_bin_29]|uniref:HD domain-containing protein n=1 Tax=Caldilineaceae bacterium SB0675_bin_29 TaxID=2605266 RepID=A0A6B1G4E2_9CHLR|nr:HD domain-containing protein [Caldilineaceae bacterium SB0675_bin_29]